MSNTDYRKLDVDAFDPERYHDLDDGEESAGPDERLVSQLLQTSKLNEALKAALMNPPLKTKNQVEYSFIFFIYLIFYFFIFIIYFKFFIFSSFYNFL